MNALIAVFGRACELGEALGWENISLDPGCKEHQIDADWWMALNPHAQPETCSRWAKVPGYQIFFEWRGMPAGFVSFAGGILVCGSMVNEQVLLAALEAAIARAGEKGDPKPIAAKVN